jgi:hypothetical protein
MNHQVNCLDEDSAERVRGKIDHISRHLVFVSALWVALTTAILCAILPTGLPLTKSVGSAFSPSTTVVALRGRAEQVRSTEQRVVKGDPARLTDLTPPTNHPVFATPAVAAIAASFSLLKLPTDGRTVARPLPSTPTTEAYPRGPPTA